MKSRALQLTGNTCGYGVEMVRDRAHFVNIYWIGLDWSLIGWDGMGAENMVREGLQ